MLCSECFAEVVMKKKPIAECIECKKEYNLNEKASLFKIRLEGGYTKDGMNKNEVVKFIKDGKILPEEHIATHNGVWITIADSPFANNLNKKTLTNERSKIKLYQKRARTRVAIFSVSFILILSLLCNIAMLYIIYMLNMRIEEMVLRITGG